jgi:hypothetical protein
MIMVEMRARAPPSMGCAHTAVMDGSVPNLLCLCTCGVTAASGARGCLCRVWGQAVTARLHG